MTETANIGTNNIVPPNNNNEIFYKIWRHTVGRISCLIRLPIYLAGVAFQGLKTVVKIPIAFVATPIAYFAGTKKLDAWTFAAVARDAIMTGSLMDRTINTAICVIYAPPREYHALDEGTVRVLKTVFVDNYHRVSVQSLFDTVVWKRPQYHKLIVDQEANSVMDHVYHDDLITILATQKIDGVVLSNSILRKDVKAG